MLESVIAYMKAMQHTHYSGELCFELLELLNRVQHIGQKPLYLQWKKALSEVGIGRPGLIRFKLQVIPKRYPFLVKNH